MGLTGAVSKYLKVKNFTVSWSCVTTHPYHVVYQFPVRGV